jgi:hypothetical protein
MRKAILGLLFSLWSSVASAGITCSLPFTLVNGTTADASQVMANYNALVACLASAASAGANTDITSLLGLTTPLSYTFGGSSVYIGGTSTGSANAYVVASPLPAGFSLTAGKVVHFIANFSNNGATTLNANGTGAINLFRQTPSGPVAMLGGEIVANQSIWAEYDGTEFQCLNCAATNLVPTGTTLDFSGVVIPSGFVLAIGQTLSRTTFSALFNTLSMTSVPATTNGTTTVSITGAAALGIQVGWYVGGNNVTCNSFITTVNTNSIVINNAAGASGATTLTLGPYQQGDCSTTFTLPNYTGKLLAGVDGATNITATTCPNSASIGDKTQSPNTGCGAQIQTLTLAQIPTGITASNGAVSITVTGPIGGHNMPLDASLSASTSSGATPVWAGGGVSTTTSFSGSNSVSVTSNNTSGGAHPILPPTSLVYKIIKT